MIPLEIPFLIWIAATVVSGAAAIVAIRGHINSMGMALIGFSVGALLMTSFYGALLYAPFKGDYAVMIPWSRWAISINGLMILGGSVAAFIVNWNGKK